MANLQQLPTLLTAFGLQNIAALTLFDASRLDDAHIPPFAPDTPCLLLDIDPSKLDNLRTVLSAVYPDAHPLRALDGERRVTTVNLNLLGAQPAESRPQALYIPALGESASLTSFQEIVARLRAPDGCPWDKKQTHQTLRKHLLEESYETLAAMDADDAAAMTEEFGDLLLQIVLNAQIASESKKFGMADVISGISEKIIRRHPHVFGNWQVDGVGEVLKNWEDLKAQERKSNGETEKGLLDGVPAALPALNQAQEYQDRAARVGFDWPEIDGVLDKLVEEIEEIRQAANDEERAAEIGDLFFVLVNFARWQGADAEFVLREANLRFKRRFAYIERSARERERPLSSLTLEEMEALWVEAKNKGL